LSLVDEGMRDSSILKYNQLAFHQYLGLFQGFEAIGCMSA
jgi:hypothetical protein